VTSGEPGNVLLPASDEASGGDPNHGHPATDGIAQLVARTYTHKAVDYLT